MLRKYLGIIRLTFISLTLQKDSVNKNMIIATFYSSFLDFKPGPSDP